MTLKWASAAGLQSITAGLEWPSVTGTPTIETTIVRSNGTAFRIAPGATKQMQHNAYSSGQGAKYYRVYFWLVTSPNATRAFVSIDNGSSPKIGIRMTTGRVLQLFNEEDAAQIGSDSSAINTGEFYRLELKVDDTTLATTSVEARLYAASDEATLAWNPSGTANLSVAANRFSVANRNDTTLDFVFTDLTIIEGDGTAPNTWAGEGSIVYLRPDGNGASSQWTGSDGNSTDNYLLVDETPPNDATDYVESNTNNQTDSYTLGATPGAVGSGDVINWVAPGVRFAISNTTSTDPDFVLQVTAGGNTQESGNISGAGATAYASYQTTPVCVLPLVLVDMPGASTTAYTKSALDSTEIGIRESATDAHFARVSALWLMFDHKAGSGGHTVAVNQVTETDTAQALTRVKYKAIAQVTETDLAQAITGQRRYAVAQVTETDTAQALSAIKQKAIGQVTETDTAQTITVQKIKLIAQVTETDLAQAITVRKIQYIAQVTETDSAQAITRLKYLLIGQVSETDLAQALSRTKTKEIGQVSETDTAQPVLNSSAILVSQVEETALAQALFGMKRIAVAQVIEIDLAQALVRMKIATIGQVTETDLAQAITVAGSSIGISIHIDRSEAFVVEKTERNNPTRTSAREIEVL